MSNNIPHSILIEISTVKISKFLYNPTANTPIYSPPKIKKTPVFSKVIKDKSNESVYVIKYKNKYLNISAKDCLYRYFK